MKKPENGITTLFDIQTGKLTIGDAAIEDLLECGTDPRDMLPLAEVLLNSEIEIRPQHYDGPKGIDSNAEEVSCYGGWLSRIVNTNLSDEVVLDRKLLDRAHNMGLGLHSKYIAALFEGKLWKFRRQAGIATGRESGRFDDWTSKDYVEYAMRVHRGLKRKPTYDDFQRWWRKRREGPSGSYILKNYPGGVGGLVERIGFPDIPSWDRDEYIDYGVRFMRANPGVRMTAQRLNYLSRQKRGPSVRGINDNVGSVLEFADEAKQRHDWLEAQRVDLEETLLIGFKQKAETDEAFARLFEKYIGNHTRLLQICCRYILVDHFIPNLNAKEKEATSIIMSGDRFAVKMQEHNNSITQAIVETRASQLGIFDFIWPFDEYLTYLQLPTEMLPKDYRPTT